MNTREFIERIAQLEAELSAAKAENERMRAENVEIRKSACLQDLEQRQRQLRETLESKKVINCLEAERDTLRVQLEQVQDQRNFLDARVQYMSRPVTDEEWKDIWLPLGRLFVKREVMKREDVDAVLAARAAKAKEQHG